MLKPILIIFGIVYVVMNVLSWFMLSHRQPGYPWNWRVLGGPWLYEGWADGRGKPWDKKEERQRARS